MPSILNRTLVIALIVLSCAACGDDESPTTPSTNTPVRSTEVFGGTLGIGDSQFYSFTAAQDGTTEVTLLSLRPAGVTTSPLGLVVGLGLGTPAGTECALTSAITTAPALTKQLSVATNTSTYCVKIADVGNLTAAVDYTVRILHP